MLGKLAPCGGGRPIPLLKPKLLVGRYPGCDLPLAFSSVSARHCELELVDGYWFVRDLGSTNGTHVNGKAVAADWLLPNDVLGLAKHRYAVVYSPPPGRPPPRRAGSPAASPPGPPPPVAVAPRPAAGPAAPPPAAAPGPVLGKLVPCGGGPPVPLTRPRLVVGRHDGCDIVLRSGLVSGRHCELEWAEGGWRVRDLGSKNGTYVDRERCEAERRLPPGSVLWVANLRFEVVYAGPGAAARPQPPLFGQSLLEKAGLTRWRPSEPPARGRGTTDAEDAPPRERYTLDDPEQGCLAGARFVEEIAVPTVLVVDDSPVDRRLAGALLEKYSGCVLLFAEDGADALRQMGQQLPDLVLTDLQMPHMNGLELTAAVKSEYPLVPVVLMTAQGSEEIAAQALRRGAASYVPKRNLADDLVPTVLRVLLGAHADRAHSQLMHHLETSTSVFVLDNDPGLIQAMVNHLQELLRCLPLADETERLRVGVALEEALTNACYHGNLEVGDGAGPVDRRACEERAERARWEPPYSDRRIHVSARLSREEAVVVIRDEGRGFDVAGLPAADGSEAERAVGRGVTLMRTIMDEVVYNAAGNEVTLIKRRAPDPPPDEGAEGEPA